MGSSFSLNQKCKVKAMEERKNTLILTANILGLSLEEFSHDNNHNHNHTIVEMLDMKNERNEHSLNEKRLIIVNYALASLDQIYPPYRSYTLRNSNPKAKPSWMKGFSVDEVRRASELDSGMMTVNSYYKISGAEAIKYIVPNQNCSCSLSFRYMNDMTFQTGQYLCLNGLNFYPSSIISKEMGQMAVRFKSDGLFVNSRDEKLISQLKEALVRNKKDIDQIYDGGNENAELSEGGALLGERRLIKKQLQLQLKNQQIQKKVYLTLDVPVGWSCVAHCYWVNLSIMNS